MPFKSFDTKDAVPEAQRGEAIETKDGKFAVWEPDKTAQDVANLQSTLEREREKTKEAERVKAELERKLADAEREKTAKGKGITEDQLQALRDEDKKAREPLEKRIADLETENRQIKLTDRVKALALAKGVMADRIDDAMLILEKRTALTSDGKGIVVKDKDGKETTEPIETFLDKTFRAEKAWLYKGTGTSGSGAEGSNAGGGGSGDANERARAAGKAMAERQKQSAADKSLAFQ